MPEFRLTARSGSTVFVAGLVGREPDGSPGADLDRQVERILDRLVQALAGEGLQPADLVRLRFYLTDVTTWPDVLPRLLATVGPSVPPATVVGVTALVEPWMRIELDAEANAG